MSLNSQPAPHSFSFSPASAHTVRFPKENNTTNHEHKRIIKHRMMSDHYSHRVCLGLDWLFLLSSSSRHRRRRCRRCFRLLYFSHLCALCMIWWIFVLPNRSFNLIITIRQRKEKRVRQRKRWIDSIKYTQKSKRYTHTIAFHIKLFYFFFRRNELLISSF